MRVVTLLLFVISMGASAQTKAFEVASVKVGAPRPPSISTGPNTLTMRGVRMKDCIGWAYDIQEPQIVGPDWLNETPFDIVARSTGPANEADLRIMLQNLLADRFKLTFRRETREIPALILVVSSKGHKLVAAEKPGDPSFSTGKMSLTGEGATLSELTRFLARELREPVVDRTGLTGLFNYKLDITAYVTEEIRKSGG